MNLVKSHSILLNFIVATSLLIDSSCVRDQDAKGNIPAGISSTVSGTLIENDSGKPLETVKVLIEEFVDNHKPDLTFSKSIDSTFSNAQGKYTITFKTTGAATQYRIGFMPSGNYLPPQILPSNIIAPGKTTMINANFTKLIALVATLHIDTIPNPPLSVYTSYGVNSLLIHQKNPIDTTVLFLMRANTLDELFFDYVNPDTLTLHNSQTDTVNLVNNFSDSVFRELTVHPAHFKGRN